MSRKDLVAGFMGENARSNPRQDLLAAKNSRWRANPWQGFARREREKNAVRRNLHTSLHYIFSMNQFFSFCKTTYRHCCTAVYNTRSTSILSTTISRSCPPHAQQLAAATAVSSLWSSTLDFAARTMMMRSIGMPFEVVMVRYFFCRHNQIECCCC